MFPGLLFLFLIPISLCAMEEGSSRRNSLDAESGERIQGSLYPMRELTYDKPEQTESCFEIDGEEEGIVDSRRKCGVMYENWKDDWRWMCSTVNPEQSCCGKIFEKSCVVLAGGTVGPPSPCCPDVCVKNVLSVCCKKSIEKRSQDFSLRLVFLRIAGCLVSGCLVF